MVPGPPWRPGLPVQPGAGGCGQAGSGAGLVLGRQAVLPGAAPGSGGALGCGRGCAAGARGGRSRSR